MPWEGVGTDRNTSQQDQQKKTDMVWSRGENGKQEITSKSLILLRGWEKEQRKTNKDMDGQCETRPCSKRHRLENGPGYYKKQREVETSCKKSHRRRTPDGREKKTM